MNPTSIEWARLGTDRGFTWNPIVGCTNGCPYCYAKRQAQKQPCALCREFVPHLHPERLNQPAGRKTPSGIFVGSMCDLWDPCVMPEWRKQVWQAIDAAPQHRYALLTKRPELVLESDAGQWGSNVALGVSVSDAADIWRLPCLMTPRALQRFVSFEPLHGPIRRSLLKGYMRGIDWAIIGAETGRRPGRVGPRLEWLVEIVDACDALGVPVFLKDNLRPYAPTGYPWRQEWPEVWG